MRLSASLAALVIGALATFGNPAAGAALSEADRAAVEALRTGDMAKLLIHAEPKPAVDTPFKTAEGAETSFAAFRGQVTLVNFWATWCPPCLKEMPALDRLAAALEGDGIRVATINVERGGVRKAAAWMEEQGLERLPGYADEANALPRALGVLGLPTTIILDPEGREIARLQGDAEWDSEAAEAILRALSKATAAGG